MIMFFSAEIWTISRQTLWCIDTYIHSVLEYDNLFEISPYICVVNRKVARASQIGFLCILFCILKSQCVVPAYNQMPFGCVLRNTSDIFTTVSSNAWCEEVHLCNMQNARQYGGKKCKTTWVMALCGRPCAPFSRLVSKFFISLERTN